MIIIIILIIIIMEMNLPWAWKIWMAVLTCELHASFSHLGLALGGDRFKLQIQLWTAFISADHGRTSIFYGSCCPYNQMPRHLHAYYSSYNTWFMPVTYAHMGLPKMKLKSSLKILNRTTQLLHYNNAPLKTCLPDNNPFRNASASPNLLL